MGIEEDIENAATPEDALLLVRRLTYERVVEAYGVMCLSEDDAERADALFDIAVDAGKALGLSEEQIREDLENSNIREVAQAVLHINDGRNN